MPVLAKEQDLYPFDLLDCYLDGRLEGQSWWAMYTRSRREKELMRQLRAMDIGFYGPTISRRKRSASGRIRTSHIPLFSNYVFVCGNDSQRYEALTTGCISRHIEVADGLQLTADLKAISELIALGHPMTPESRLQKGTRVRVRSGPFANFEGTVIRRENETRLVVAVNFMQQGASVVLADCEFEPLD
jgi:transcriptional antiterminator RfaH